jgi:hypothetical protein
VTIQFGPDTSAADVVRGLGIDNAFSPRDMVGIAVGGDVSVTIHSNPRHFTAVVYIPDRDTRKFRSDRGDEWWEVR